MMDKTRLLFFLAGGLSFGQCAVLAATDTATSVLAAPNVTLDYAQYEGSNYAVGVDAFLGMRFAAPPVGDLRFRAPEDPPVEADSQEAKEVSIN